tara:strand:- start:159 stop:374 length:216 start_codon:yes stop_codon:yes gene_type:complete
MEDKIQFSLINGWHVSVGIDEKENVLHLQIQNDSEKPLIEWAYSEEEAEEKEPLIWRQAFTTELLEEDEEN